MNYDFDSESTSLEVIKLLLNASLWPVLLFTVILVILYQSKTVLSVSAKFRAAVYSAILFLFLALAGMPMSVMNQYHIMIYSYLAFAVCGLGMSLFACRLSKFRRISLWGIILWTLTTGTTLYIVIEAVPILLKRN